MKLYHIFPLYVKYIIQKNLLFINEFEQNLQRGEAELNYTICAVFSEFMRIKLVRFPVISNNIRIDSYPNKKRRSLLLLRFNFESTGFKVAYSIPCFLLLLFVWSFGVLGFLASLAASRFIFALSK